MPGITMFFLFLAVVYGIMTFIHNPLIDFLARYGSMTGSEISADMKTKIDKLPEDELLGTILAVLLRWGCFFGCSMASGFILEPIMVITALTSKIGNPVPGYVALLVIVITYVRLFLNRSKSTDHKLVTVRSVEDKELPGILVENEKTLGETVGPFYMRWRLVGLIPTLYLGYIFLIGIGILS